MEIGGLLGKSLFEEMRYCFVYGQFIAASALGMAYIEQTFAAYFYGIGRNDLQRASLAELLREACEHGLINSDQLEELNRIRRSRNVYNHFRRPLHEEAVEVRAIEEDESFYGIIEQDATSIVEAVLWIYSQLWL